MNILILGAGQVGSELAEILSKDNHNITLVDQKKESLDKVSDNSVKPSISVNKTATA